MTYRAEVGFYRDLASQLDVAVPRCYFADVSTDGTAFTLLLQDMAPAEVGDQLAGCTADTARAAALAVARLHAGSWCEPTIADHEWLIPSMAGLAELVGPMLVDAAEVFLTRRQLDDATEEVLRRFAQNFVAWATSRPTPWTLLHNDFRLDNLLFTRTATALPAVTTIDWQSLSSGHPLRDVAFLLGTGLQPAVRRANERDIVTAYFGALESLGVLDYTGAQCWDDYRHGLFHGPFICLMADGLSPLPQQGPAPSSP